MFKKITSIIIAFVIMFSFSYAMFANTSIPQYAITDTYVIIDYEPYPITDNSITYNDTIYLIENYALVSYDDIGEKTVWILPIEQNRVTDPSKLIKLQAVNNSKSLSDYHGFPTDYVLLPYSQNIPTGSTTVTTPFFEIINGQFYYRTKLTLSDFPWFTDRRFEVTFYVCEVDGNWYSSTITQDFFYNNTIKFQNSSSYCYGIFEITHQYGTAPSYKYNISLANL